MVLIKSRVRENVHGSKIESTNISSLMRHRSIEDQGALLYCVIIARAFTTFHFDQIDLGAGVKKKAQIIYMLVVMELPICHFFFLQLAGVSSPMS